MTERPSPPSRRSGLHGVWALVSVALVLLLSAGGLRRGGSRKPTRGAAPRLLPDLVRLLRGLAADPSLARGVRIRLVLLVGYLVFPLDLVPDFIPVIGYADGAIIVALALRSVVRRAGPEALQRHWTGTPEGLHVITRLAGVRAST